jgi:sulfur carrier protein
LKLWINGDEAELTDGRGVDEVLSKLQIPDSRGVAIAVDGEVVPRGKWSDIQLKEGQRVEVVRAVQGGSA